MYSRDAVNWPVPRLDIRRGKVRDNTYSPLRRFVDGVDVIMAIIHRRFDTRTARKNIDPYRGGRTPGTDFPTARARLALRQKEKIVPATTSTVG